MKQEQFVIDGITLDVWTVQTVVVGSGAAGLNAADSLYNLGQKDVALVTEGFNMGTSRNTGSDKQTYYKMTLAGNVGDSVAEMARTLFEGGSRHGDVALVEAALSTRCFFKLVEIGVDFPHNRYGEYVGYKTDHDPRQRATSVGPLTSKMMTERLEHQVRSKQLPIFDGYLVIGVLTDEVTAPRQAVGLVAVDLSRSDDPSRGLTLFNCTNIIYATGGPAGIYSASVYPGSQTGSNGSAFEAGVRGVNLTESQFGIASTRFRWNLSGTYQQVLPRYISTDPNGLDEREFLDEYFPDAGTLLTAIFLKGYQWPFDPRKIDNHGSSLIDILVFNETTVKGRRVFLDFTRNPSQAAKADTLDFSVLSAEAHDYLAKSEALFGTPIDRLKKMNPPAVELYRDHGIDLEREPLEIAICVQHNNGGLVGDIWWESNLEHFFPVGEVNGSFGVYRPGGSALNATQVGSLRAAQYIRARYMENPPEAVDFIRKTRMRVISRLKMLSALTETLWDKGNLAEKIFRLQVRMTEAGGPIRDLQQIGQALQECVHELQTFPAGVKLERADELPEALRFHDMLITQFVYLSAIAEYIRHGGQSRGSYLVRNPEGRLPADGLPELFRFSLDDGKLQHSLCEVGLHFEAGWQCRFTWSPVKPVPQEDNWFEKTWADFREGKVFDK